MSDIMDKISELLGDEESMKQLSELAGMIMSGDENTPQSSDNASDTDSIPFDFGKLMMLQGIMEAFKQNDKNTELLIALKPHLNADKQPKVDKAVKILRLLAVFNILKENGMLQDLL